MDSIEREMKITEFRRSKPVKELERKYEKAKGRYSKRFPCVEAIDFYFSCTNIMRKVFKLT